MTSSMPTKSIAIGLNFDDSRACCSYTSEPRGRPELLDDVHMMSFPTVG